MRGEPRGWSVVEGQSSTDSIGWYAASLIWSGLLAGNFVRFIGVSPTVFLRSNQVHISIQLHENTLQR